MVAATEPRLKLLAETIRGEIPAWRFVLESLEGDRLLEASDGEPGVDGDRLDLLALVRGLESIDQPSRLTLVTPSRYVRRGLSYGIEDWRRNGWRWENFGLLVPVKNADLWQRVDRALSFHQLEGKTFRLDVAHPAGLAAETELEPAQGVVSRPRHLVGRPMRTAIRVHRLWLDTCEHIRWRLAQYGTPLMKGPWLD